MEVQAAEDYSCCRTPRCKIPAAAACPAAPRKKRVAYLTKAKTLSLPKDGYFWSPEMEVFFASAFRQQQGV